MHGWTVPATSHQLNECSLHKPPPRIRAQLSRANVVESILAAARLSLVAQQQVNSGHTSNRVQSFQVMLARTLPKAAITSLLRCQKRQASPAVIVAAPLQRQTHEAREVC